MPVPISWVPASTVTLPFAASATRALQAKRKVDMIAEAMPRPISLPFSRRARGLGARSDQPMRRAPSA